MIRRMCDILLSALIAGVLYSACADPAVAQNVTCATRPNGDNTNACADTAFVQNAFAGGSSLALANGSFLIGGVDGLAHAQILSGDCTSTNAGVVTCTKLNGVAYSAAPATDTVPIITAANTSTYTALPSCSTAGTALQYSTSTHLFSCASSGGTVATIAALKAQTPPANGTSVYVLGYYAAGDGGQGWFVYNTATATADNGGTIIQPNSLPANGRWLRNVDVPGTASVLWFGAKGDATNDDTAAILATAAWLGNESTIVFPTTATYYKCASKCLSYKNAYGIRITGATASGNGFPTRAIIMYTGTTGNLGTFEGTEGVEIDHISLQYNAPTYNGDLIDLRQGTGSILTAGTHIHDFMMSGQSGTAVSANSLVRLGNTLKTHIHDGFMNLAATGIYSDAVTPVEVVNIHDIWFQNFSTIAVSWSGINWTISSITAEINPSGEGRFLVASAVCNGCNVINSWFGDSTLTTGKWIDVTAGQMLGGQISGNFFSGANTVYVDLGTSAGVSFTGNYFSTTTATGLVIASGVSNIIAAGNFVLGGRAVFTSAGIPGGLSDNGSSAFSFTSVSSSALAVGRLGSTNPAFQVDSSTASQAAGLKLTGAATGGTVALAAIDSGSNTNLSIDAKGTGTITVAGTSTGAITLSRATTLSGALTYGGVTLSNAVTGTGNMVLSAGPTLTGTLTAANIVANSGANVLAPITIEKTGGDVFAFRFNSSNGRMIFGVGGASGAPGFGVNMVHSGGANNIWNFDKTGPASLFGNMLAGSDANYLCGATGTAGNSTQFDTGLGCGISITTTGELAFNFGGTPTIASGACGTGANGVITSGTNQAGLISIGAAATTTCTVSFSRTLGRAPAACVIFPANATAAATGTTVARVSSIATTGWVITGSALANANYYYHCI